MNTSFLKKGEFGGVLDLTKSKLDGQGVRVRLLESGVGYFFPQFCQFDSEGYMVNIFTAHHGVRGMDRCVEVVKNMTVDYFRIGVIESLGIIELANEGPFLKRLYPTHSSVQTI